jgi:hypothetical protein
MKASRFGCPEVIHSEVARGRDAGGEGPPEGRVQSGDLHRRTAIDLEGRLRCPYSSLFNKGAKTDAPVMVAGKRQETCPALSIDVDQSVKDTAPADLHPPPVPLPTRVIPVRICSRAAALAMV